MHSRKDGQLFKDVIVFRNLDKSLCAQMVIEMKAFKLAKLNTDANLFILWIVRNSYVK